MDDVRKWLNGLGLGHLADVFARSQIDLDSLRLLSNEDLREMQIPLGPRKKILAGIKLLNQDDTPASIERRQLTILFCDLVGSTEYATRLDPEDFTKLTQAYLSECTSAVRKHNGIAANYIGDAVQVLFGYPVAEEDDAERALELAFDLLRQIPQIAVPDGPPLRVRIGVASGLVVVGDFVGAPAGVSTVALGSIPSLAQRLQTVAEPQTVLADQKTHDAAAGAFEFTDLGALPLKGFPSDVHVWRADKPRVVENRFAKRGGLTELVDRQDEISSLLDLWQQVIDHQRGQAALIFGEPGIGKSRLIFEVQRRIAQCTYLTLQCANAYSNSALFPFLTLMKRNVGINGNDLPENSLKKLETFLAFSEVPLSDSLPIFADLLAIPQTQYPVPMLTSARQRDLSRKVLIDWLRHLTQTAPLLLLIEDEHWIDPSSSDVLQALIGEATAFPILIVITTRARAMRTPPTKGEIFEIALQRLAEDDALTLVKALTIGQNLPDETNLMLLEKAEGVPLYAEELARAVLEGGASFTVQQLSKSSSIGVPSSIQSSLLSRLDKIGPGKMIAQIAAVVGREFDLRLVAHLCGLSPAEMDPVLQGLVEARLISVPEGADRAYYTFTHALLHEAAHETLLKKRSRELHGEVARAIETIHPRLAREHPEVLAQHFTEAEQFERAAECWLAAGRNTGKTWAKVEAANMFANGLKCLARLPASEERDRMELQLELERGDVLYATFGYVTEEGSTAYRNVMRLSEKLGDVDAPIRALDGLFGIALNSARFTDAEWAGDQLLNIGRTRNSLRALVLGMQFKGMCLFSRGQLAQARDYLEEALRHIDHGKEIGSDFPSMTMLYLSWTLQLLGEEQRAIELYEAAEADARGHSAYRLAACLGNCCILHALRDDPAPLPHKLDELSTLARENGFRMWQNFAAFFQGWTAVRATGDADGLEKMQQTCKNLGDQQIDKSCYLGLLADGYLQLGDIDQATATLNEAFNLVGQTGENYFTAELLRLRAEVELRAGMPDTAAASFREAIEFARRQGALTWERKAMRSLALSSLGSPDAESSLG